MTEHEHVFLRALDERIETLKHLNHSLAHSLKELAMIPQAFTDNLATLNQTIANLPQIDPNAITTAEGQQMANDVAASNTALQAKLPTPPTA